MRGMVDGVEREQLYKGRRLRLRVAAGGGVGSGRGGREGSVLAKGHASLLIPNPYFTLSLTLFYPYFTLIEPLVNP